MKTSFYFFLWNIVYIILGLISVALFEEYGFVIALFLVFGITRLIDALMPKICEYEKASNTAPVLEEVYSNNIPAFNKRLTRTLAIRTLSALYYILTTGVVGYTVFVLGVDDWFALIVFGIFAILSIANAIDEVQAKFALRAHPTKEQCIKIATKTYGLDYESYSEQRAGTPYEDILPPRPKGYIAYLVVSLIIAIITTLFGLIFIISAVGILLGTDIYTSGAVFGMVFLYGSLAFYYSVKDIISITQSLTKRPNYSAICEKRSNP